MVLIFGIDILFDSKNENYCQGNISQTKYPIII